MTLKFAAGLAAVALAASTASALAYPSTTTRATYLHTGPGEKYSLVTPVPGAAHVNVQHCLGSWCRVVWTQYAGYMPAALLATGGYPHAGVYYGAPPTYVAPAPAPPPPGYGGYPGYCNSNYDPDCAGGYYGDYGYPYGVWGGYGGGYGWGGWGGGWGHRYYGGYGHYGNGGAHFGGGHFGGGGSRPR